MWVLVCPSSSLAVVWANQGHWARTGFPAGSQLIPGSIVKPVFPHQLFGISDQAAEVGNTSSR